MKTSGDAATARDVWRFVQELNRTWVDGDPADLRRFLHPNVVIVHPGFAGRSIGRDACVASYTAFRRAVTVHAFDEREPDVDVFDDVAVVSYTFDIGYELNGQRIREQGRDLFVLRRENKRWRAIWRTLLSETAG